MKLHISSTQKEKKKTLNQKYPTKLTSKIEGEIKTFSEKQEQEIHCPQNFYYKKILKTVLQIKRNAII